MATRSCVTSASSPAAVASAETFASLSNGEARPPSVAPKAKALALGATLGGLASPLLKLANISAEATAAGLEALVTQLRVAMFGIGATNLDALRDTSFLEKI